MIRYLPIIQLVLLVYCLIDCIQTPPDSARNLSKGWWIVLIVLIPVAGPVAWLVAGRPTAASRRRDVPWPSTQTAGFPEYERPRPARGPDDDPAFLSAAGSTVDGPDPEKEWLLEQWEQQLREREARLRDPDDAGASGGRAGDAGASDGAPNSSRNSPHRGDAASNGGGPGGAGGSADRDGGREGPTP